jgi:hypothetical protein
MRFHCNFGREWVRYKAIPYHWRDRIRWITGDLSPRSRRRRLEISSLAAIRDDLRGDSTKRDV